MYYIICDTSLKYVYIVCYQKIVIYTYIVLISYVKTRILKFLTTLI